MLSLRGTHGTTVSRACDIQESGFRIGTGRRGAGAYFWRDGRYSTDLAISWYNFEKSRERYRLDRNDNCSIIFILIEVLKDECLNTDDFDFKETLLKLAEQKEIGNSDKEIAYLYDYFVVQIEARLKKKFKVLEARVPTPPTDYCPSYPIKTVGIPHCFIVRQPGIDQIQIIDIRECGV